MIRRFWKIFERLIDKYYLKESEYQSRQKVRMDLINETIDEWRKEGREIIELNQGLFKNNEES